MTLFKNIKSGNIFKPIIQEFVFILYLEVKSEFEN